MARPRPAPRSPALTPVPEYGLHWGIAILLLLTYNVWMFIFNVPLAVWHALRLRDRNHLFDPTSLMKYATLRELKQQAIGKLVFYVVLLFWMAFRMIDALVMHIFTNPGDIISAFAFAGGNRMA